MPSQRREDFELISAQSRSSSRSRLEGRLAEGRAGEYKPRIQVDTSRPSTSAGPASASGSGSGPVRVSPTARGHAQFHPYRRPQSGAGRSRRDTEQHVRFAGEGQPQGLMSAPSATPSSRIVSLGSTIGSMRCALQLVFTWPVPQHIRCFIGSSPIASAIPQQERTRRFIIRTDVHYDVETKVLTAHLELPGLKQRDLSITLSTCWYNRVRQVVVAGRSKPVLPDAGYAIRERKFGEFQRTFVVPPETKVRLSILCAAMKLTVSSRRSLKMFQQRCKMAFLS